MRVYLSLSVSSLYRCYCYAIINLRPSKVNTHTTVSSTRWHAKQEEASLHWRMIKHILTRVTLQLWSTYYTSIGSACMIVCYVKICSVEIYMPYNVSKSNKIYIERTKCTSTKWYDCIVKRHIVLSIMNLPIYKHYNKTRWMCITALSVHALHHWVKRSLLK